MRAGAVSRAAVGPGLGLWAKQYLVSPSSSALVAATNRITGTRLPVSRQWGSPIVTLIFTIFLEKATLSSPC